MRRQTAFMLFSVLCAGQAAQIGAQAAECARQAERPAFEVAELKSELMVTAISCKDHDHYNAFIGRYGSDIVGNEKTLNAYFSRNFGRQGQKAHDEYITSLANAQSQQGLKQGSAFCGEREPMFDEVMALRNADDLSPYAEGKDLAVPASLTICTSEPVEKGRHRGGRGGHHAARASRHTGSKS